MSTREHDETVARRAAQDDVLVAALAIGLSYPQAAERAGVSVRTVARRMDDAEFARRVSVRRGEHVSAVAGQLTTLGSGAVDTIRGCLDDDDPRVRLTAAKLALDYAARFRTTHDLEIQVAEIRGHLGMEA